MPRLENLDRVPQTTVVILPSVAKAQCDGEAIAKVCEKFVLMKICFMCFVC